MNTSTTEKKGLNISAKSFLSALVVIFALMILTYILTLLVPDGGIPFWKWLLSPVLVLGAEGSGSLIAVIAFLLVIGGVFNSLEKGGLMRYLLDWITFRFGKNRYELLAVITFFFMAMGAFIGSFEECVPLVPIVVALAIRLGWDALTGLGMSLLAAGCGFASGVCNPFTVGVAQELAGLPMFSGMWMRLLAFALIYGLLLFFLKGHVKKLERLQGGRTAQKTTGQRDITEEKTSQGGAFQRDPHMQKGLVCFVSIVGLGIVLVLSSIFLTFLQDITMIIIAVMFLVAGIAATLVSGMGLRRLGQTFWNGLVSMLPAVLMILMANSIKYTMVEGNILDTILQGAIELAQTLPRELVILFIYLIVLVMNFFIPSGSAKAFLLIPLIVPAAEVFGISAQLCILAFAFGDGFSNAFYPTNPVLLISLGLADVNYFRWAKWSGKFQLWNLLLTSALLLLGLAAGY